MLKRSGMRSFLLLVLVLSSLFVCFSATAEQENDFELWVSPSGKKDIDAILWYTSDDAANSYYFFLPGGIKQSSLKIGFNKYDYILINGKKVKNGASASVLLQENPVTINGKKSKLFVMRGSKNLPAVFVSTESGSLATIHQDKANKEPGDIRIYAGNGSVAYEGHLNHLKIRGNASVKFDKKNYQFKLENGADLFGMGKAKKWILVSNHLDKALIRNQMNFDMAMYAGLQYTPEHRQCELYINNQYLGLYMLTEKIEPDHERVDIANLEKITEKLNSKDLSSYPVGGNTVSEPGNFKGYEIPVNPADITGGYIIEFESIRQNEYEEASSAYKTTGGSTVVVKYPEYASLEQMEYITALIQSFENAIYAEDGIDPVTGKHFTDIIDLDSFVIKYLINEISGNYDANSSSEYFYKPQDSISTKLYAGPVWDLDNTYAIYANKKNIERVLTATGFLANDSNSVYDSKGVEFWWPALYKQPVFYQRVLELYKDIFVPALNILLGKKKDPNGILLSLDKYEAQISDSAAMNYRLYPKLKKEYGNVQTGKNLHKNIAYIKDYLTQRKKFLDKEWILPAK